MQQDNNFNIIQNNEEFILHLKQNLQPYEAI